jgi:kinetochor protein Mis14/NSL1
MDTQFIRETYTYAADSLTINGLEFDSASISASKNTAAAAGNDAPFPFPSAFSAPNETIEYEPYDGNLASRVSSLYAQLESLTTTVAQLRRDAPGRAAKIYAANLRGVLEGEDEEFERVQNEQQRQGRKRRRVERDKGGDGDMDMEGRDDEEEIDAEFRLDIPFGTQAERERWQSGEMAEIYTDTLRTLLRLQGEESSTEAASQDDSDNKAISTTVATAERAEKAVDVVERMV